MLRPSALVEEGEASRSKDAPLASGFLHYQHGDLLDVHHDDSRACLSPRGADCLPQGILLDLGSPSRELLPADDFTCGLGSPARELLSSTDCSDGWGSHHHADAADVQELGFVHDFGSAEFEDGSCLLNENTAQQREGFGVAQNAYQGFDSGAQLAPVSVGASVVPTNERTADAVAGSYTDKSSKGRTDSASHRRSSRKKKQATRKTKNSSSKTSDHSSSMSSLHVSVEQPWLDQDQKSDDVIVVTLPVPKPHTCRNAESSIHRTSVQQSATNDPQFSQVCLEETISLPDDCVLDPPQQIKLNELSCAATNSLNANVNSPDTHTLLNEFDGFVPQSSLEQSNGFSAEDLLEHCEDLEAYDQMCGGGSDYFQELDLGEHFGSSVETMQDVDSVTRGRSISYHGGEMVDLNEDRLHVESTSEHTDVDAEMLPEILLLEEHLGESGVLEHCLFATSELGQLAGQGDGASLYSSDVSRSHTVSSAAESTGHSQESGTNACNPHSSVNASVSFQPGKREMFQLFTLPCDDRIGFPRVWDLTVDTASSEVITQQRSQFVAASQKTVPFDSKEGLSAVYDICDMGQIPNHNLQHSSITLAPNCRKVPDHGNMESTQGYPFDTDTDMASSFEAWARITHSEASGIQYETGNTQYEAVGVPSEAMDIPSEAVCIPSKTSLQLEAEGIPCDTVGIQMIKSEAASIPYEASGIQSETGGIRSEAINIPHETLCIKSEKGGILSNVTGLLSETLDVCQRNSGSDLDTPEITVLCMGDNVYVLQLPEPSLSNETMPSADTRSVMTNFDQSEEKLPQNSQKNVSQPATEANALQTVCIADIEMETDIEQSADLLPDISFQVKESRTQAVPKVDEKQRKCQMQSPALFRLNANKKNGRRKSASLGNGGELEANDLSDNCSRGLKTSFSIQQYHDNIYICPFDLNKDEKKRGTTNENLTPALSDQALGKLATALTIEQNCLEKSKEAKAKLKRMMSADVLSKVKSRTGEFYCDVELMKRKTVREILKDAGCEQAMSDAEPKLTVGRGSLRSKRKYDSLSEQSKRSKSGSRRKRKADKEVYIVDQHADGQHQPTACCRRKRSRRKRDSQAPAAAECPQNGSKEHRKTPESEQTIAENAPCKVKEKSGADEHTEKVGDASLNTLSVKACMGEQRQVLGEKQSTNIRPSGNQPVFGQGHENASGVGELGEQLTSAEQGKQTGEEQAAIPSSYSEQPSTAEQNNKKLETRFQGELPKHNGTQERRFTDQFISCSERRCDVVQNGMQTVIEADAQVDQSFTGEQGANPDDEIATRADEFGNESVVDKQSTSSDEVQSTTNADPNDIPTVANEQCTKVKECLCIGPGVKTANTNNNQSDYSTENQGPGKTTSNSEQVEKSGEAQMANISTGSSRQLEKNNEQEFESIMAVQTKVPQCTEQPHNNGHLEVVDKLMPAKVIEHSIVQAENTGQQQRFLPECSAAENDNERENERADLERDCVREDAAEDSSDAISMSVSSDSSDAISMSVSSDASDMEDVLAETETLQDDVAETETVQSAGREFLSDSVKDRENLDISCLPVVRREGRFIDSETIYNGEINTLYRAPFLLVVQKPTASNSHVAPSLPVSRTVVSETLKDQLVKGRKGTAVTRETASSSVDQVQGSSQRESWKAGMTVNSVSQSQLQNNSSKEKSLSQEVTVARDDSGMWLDTIAQRENSSEITDFHYLSRFLEMSNQESQYPLGTGNNHATDNADNSGHFAGRLEIGKSVNCTGISTVGAYSVGPTGFSGVFPSASSSSFTGGRDFPVSTSQTEFVKDSETITSSAETVFLPHIAGQVSQNGTTAAVRYTSSFGDTSLDGLHSRADTVFPNVDFVEQNLAAFSGENHSRECSGTLNGNLHSSCHENYSGDISRIIKGNVWTYFEENFSGKSYSVASLETPLVVKQESGIEDYVTVADFDDFIGDCFLEKPVKFDNDRDQCLQGVIDSSGDASSLPSDKTGHYSENCRSLTVNLVRESQSSASVQDVEASSTELLCAMTAIHGQTSCGSTNHSSHGEHTEEMNKTEKTRASHPVNCHTDYSHTQGSMSLQLRPFVASESSDTFETKGWADMNCTTLGMTSTSQVDQNPMHSALSVQISPDAESKNSFVFESRDDMNRLTPALPLAGSQNYEPLPEFMPSGQHVRSLNVSGKMDSAVSGSSVADNLRDFQIQEASENKIQSSERFEISDGTCHFLSESGEACSRSVQAVCVKMKDEAKHSRFKADMESRPRDDAGDRLGTNGNDLLEIWMGVNLSSTVSGQTADNKTVQGQTFQSLARENSVRVMAGSSQLTVIPANPTLSANHCDQGQLPWLWTSVNVPETANSAAGKTTESRSKLCGAVGNLQEHSSLGSASNFDKLLEALSQHNAPVVDGETLHGAVNVCVRNQQQQTSDAPATRCGQDLCTALPDVQQPCPVFSVAQDSRFRDISTISAASLARLFSSTTELQSLPVPGSNLCERQLQNSTTPSFSTPSCTNSTVASAASFDSVVYSEHAVMPFTSSSGILTSSESLHMNELLPPFISTTATSQTSESVAGDNGNLLPMVKTVSQEQPMKQGMLLPVSTVQNSTSFHEQALHVSCTSSTSTALVMDALAESPESTVMPDFTENDDNSSLSWLADVAGSSSSAPAEPPDVSCSCHSDTLQSSSSPCTSWTATSQPQLVQSSSSECSQSSPSMTVAGSGMTPAESSSSLSATCSTTTRSSDLEMGVGGSPSLLASSVGLFSQTHQSLVWGECSQAVATQSAQSDCCEGLTSAPTSVLTTSSPPGSVAVTVPSGSAQPSDSSCGSRHTRIPVSCSSPSVLVTQPETSVTETASDTRISVSCADNCSQPVSSAPVTPSDARTSANCASAPHFLGQPTSSVTADASGLRDASSTPVVVDQPVSSECDLYSASSSEASSGLWTGAMKFVVRPVPPQRYRLSCNCHPMTVKSGGKTPGLPCIPFSPAMLNCPTMDALPRVVARPGDLPQNPCLVSEGVYEYSPSAADIHMAQMLRTDKHQNDVKAPDLHCKNYLLEAICIGDFVFTVSDEKYSKDSHVWISYVSRKLCYSMVLTEPLKEDHKHTGHHSVVNTEIYFSTIIGLWGSDNRLLLQLKSAPEMFIGPGSAHSKKKARRCKDIDVTGGQLRKVPYHFVTFQSRVADTIKRGLCMDSAFCDLLIRPLTVDLRETFHSMRTADSDKFCKCRGKCNNLNCGCFKSGQPCRKNCRCQACVNQFNQLQTSGVSLAAARSDRCLMDTLAKVWDVSGFVDKAAQLECCGADTTFLHCIPGPQQCPKCSASLRLSWCLGKVMVEDSRTHKHCEKCKKCVTASLGHCTTCKRCTRMDPKGDCLPCRREAEFQNAVAGTISNAE